MPATSPTTSPNERARSTNVRLIAGLAVLVASNLLFVVPFLIEDHWPGWMKAVATSLLLAPDIGTLAAVAIMGKDNFNRIVGAVKRWFAANKPAGDVGPTRHRVGIVLLLLPLVVTYVQGYAPGWLPDHSPWRLWANVVCDVMFVTSLFVLGGDFWDKLAALFVRDARAVFPATPRSLSEMSK